MAKQSIVRPRVEFHFDFLSPYAYLAQHRLRELAAIHGWDIDYFAIDLASAKRAIGNVGPTNRDLPVKLAHLQKDLQRWASMYGVPLQFPPNFNTRQLNIGLSYAPCKTREAKYVRVAYGHVWGAGEAPDSPQTLRTVAREMDWDPDAFIAFTQSEQGAEAFAASTDRAIACQVFGVPTMTVGSEMWWGNDRLFLLEKYLTKETTR